MFDCNVCVLQSRCYTCSSCGILLIHSSRMYENMVEFWHSSYMLKLFQTPESTQRHFHRFSKLFYLFPPTSDYYCKLQDPCRSLIGLYCIYIYIHVSVCDWLRSTPNTYIHICCLADFSIESIYSKQKQFIKTASNDEKNT